MDERRGERSPKRARLEDDMEDIEVLTMPEEKVFALIKDGTINHGLVLNGLMFYALTKQKESL